MAPGGKLLIVELVVPERVSGPWPDIELDLLMWVLFNGYERTEAPECGRSWKPPASA